MVEGGYALGIAFDGDGDRAIFVDATGKVVDGDAVMLMCAKQMKAEGRLKGNAIVATVMSNIGLEIALREAGIEMVRCPVGDKYVMEEMMRRGLSLGGEQSGHIIFSEYLFTGDGLATSLNVLRTMAGTRRDAGRSGVGADDLPAGADEPAREAEGGSAARCPRWRRSCPTSSRRLAGNGRLLVRYSGTEPLLRVMLEGKDQAEIRKWGQEIIDAVKEALA